MSKIMDFIRTNVGVDGLLHVLTCKVMVDAVDLIAPLWAALVVAAVVAIGKEVVWDKLLKKGTYDKKDILCDAVGILLGLI